MNNLAIGRYRFTLQAEAPFTLTGYPGAMLRGAWGHALRQLACSTGRAECTGCPVREHCRYTTLFEPLPETAQGAARNIPPPYIIEAALARPRRLAQGESWHFEMVLFGAVLSELPLIVWAWQQAASAGFGDQQSPMRLITVEYESAPGDWQPVWASRGHAVQRMTSREPRVEEHAPSLTYRSTKPHQVADNNVKSYTVISSAVIKLITPSRIQHKGRICAPQQLTAEILLTSLWRKIELYLTHYLQMEVPQPPSMQHIRLQPLSLTRQRWERHSRRQQTAMRLDGMLGALELHGSLDDWWPWLWLGQYTHLGKNTSFGLGQYQLKEPCERQ